MMIYRFYVGLGANDNGTRLTVHQIHSATDAANYYLAVLFGGYIQYEVQGAYLDPNHDPHDPVPPAILHEDMLIYECISRMQVSPESIASHLCTIFNQSAVLFTVHPVVSGVGRIPSPLTIRDKSGKEL